MLYKLLPSELFHISQHINKTGTNGHFYDVIETFQISQFDHILINFNNIWFIQTLIALLYCIRIRRFVPTQPNAKISIFIKQYLICLITNSIVYLGEILLSNTFFTKFERFAHHVVAISLFYLTCLRPNIICVCILSTGFFHSLYWFDFTLEYKFHILFIYNLSLLVNSVIIMWTTYNRTVKLYSLKVLILTGLLYNINIFGDQYGYFVNLLELDFEKAKSSLIFSLSTSSPFYFYLIYVNWEKLTKFFRIKLKRQQHVDRDGFFQIL